MWFTEDAWSPIILCMVVGVIFLIAWSTSQRPRYLIAIPVIAILAVVIYFAERAIVTDREHVEASLLDLINTFVEESQVIGTSGNEVPPDTKCLEFFSAQNVTDRARVSAALVFVSVNDDIRVTDVSIKLTNENTRAITHFRANATFSATGLDGGYHPSRWELTWQKEGDEWKVTRTKYLNIMTGDEQRIPGGVN